MIRVRVAVAFILALIAAPAVAADYPVPKQGDWVARDFQFHTGEVMPEMRLHYTTIGDPSGQPVLVLHGGTAISETMHNQITALAPHHLVIAPDSRAHGRSTDGPGPLSYHQMAEDMIALMNQLHIAKADLVGWSERKEGGEPVKHPGILDASETSREDAESLIMQARVIAGWITEADLQKSTDSAETTENEPV